MKIPKINFIDMECLPEFEDNGLYITVFSDDEKHENEYRTVMYSSADDDFSVWNEKLGQYCFMKSTQKILSIAKLGFYNSNELDKPRGFQLNDKG